MFVELKANPDVRVADWFTYFPPTTRLLTYDLAGVWADVFDENTSTGKALRTSAVEAFSSIAGLDSSLIEIESIIPTERRSGTQITFVASDAEDMDVAAVNDAMEDDSSSGFSQVFAGAATQHGVQITAPIVSRVETVEESLGTEDGTPHVSTLFIVAAVVVVVAIVALGAIVYLKNKWQTESDENEMARAPSLQGGMRSFPQLPVPEPDLEKKGSLLSQDIDGGGGVDVEEQQPGVQVFALSKLHSDLEGSGLQAAAGVREGGDNL